MLACILLGACSPLDDSPDEYVEALRPGFYFVVPTPFEATLATVAFTTAKPSVLTDPINVRVITWANEGGNIYDDTLGDSTLDSPRERGKLLDWVGAAIPPFGSAFDKVGVEMRTLMPMVGYAPVSLTGGYAEVDFMGAGVVAVGAWIDAILQLWVQCRGEIGQLIDCHGLHYVLAPKIDVYAIAGGKARMSSEQSHGFAHYLGADWYLAETSRGWVYRGKGPDEGNWKPIDAYPTYGPFATAEEAVRDAAVTLGLRPSGRYRNFYDSEDLPIAMRQIAWALHDVLAPTASEP